MQTKVAFFHVLIKSILWMAFTGCYKNHLYVQQELVDPNFLASSHVGTPDPRALAPPEGARLLIGWKFPRCVFQEQLTFFITVRFWDNTEEVLIKPVLRRSGSMALYFPNKKDCIDQQILTYKVDVFAENGALMETWKHHFWVELIKLNPDKAKSAHRSHSSVSSHPKQESVIEMP